MKPSAMPASEIDKVILVSGMTRMPHLLAPQSRVADFSVSRYILSVALRDGCLRAFRYRNSQQNHDQAHLAYYTIPTKKSQALSTAANRQTAIKVKRIQDRRELIKEANKADSVCADIDQLMLQ